MIEMIRHCSDCGQVQPFEQLHASGAGCPDFPDAYCPEWFCADCGAGLLIGFLPYLPEPAEAEPLRRLVA
jgi:hypothetical protein